MAEGEVEDSLFSLSPKDSVLNESGVNGVDQRF